MEKPLGGLVKISALLFDSKQKGYHLFEIAHFQHLKGLRGPCVKVEMKIKGRLKKWRGV